MPARAAEILSSGLVAGPVPSTALVARPYNRIPRWVKEISVGDCLTLGDFEPPRSSTLDGLSLQHGSMKYHIDYGDIVQVIGLGAKMSHINRDCILCMTKSGPMPLSPWLVSNWFVKC